MLCLKEFGTEPLAPHWIWTQVSQVYTRHISCTGCGDMPEALGFLVQIYRTNFNQNCLSQALLDLLKFWNLISVGRMNADDTEPGDLFDYEADLDRSNIVVSSTNCSGNETKYGQCSHRTGSRSDLSCNAYASIYCQGNKFRLK